jgi:methyl-accepting chemotaxis protein
MMLLTSLNSRFKVGTRINAGFGIVLALLLAVAGVGYLGLESSESTFEHYAVVAENTATLLEADRSYVAMRRNVQLYTQDGDEASLGRIKNQAKVALAKLDVVAKNAIVEERREAARQIAGQISQYLSNVELIVKSKPERDRLVNDVMNPLGAKLADTLSQFIREAIFDNDMTVAARAGAAQDHLMAARLEATRFLLTNDSAAVDIAEKRLADLNTALKRLAGVTRGERNDTVMELAKEIPEFLVAFHASVKLVAERNRIANEVNAKLADAITAAMSRVRGEQIKALASMKASSTASNASTLSTMTTGTGVAFILGLVFAFAIGRGISRPVAALTDTMNELARGNLRAEVPGTDRRDELGAMATAVLSFKQSAIENIDLQKEAAEKDRQAAADRAERDRIAAESLDSAVGGIVKAAMAGDFSQRVPLEGKDGVIRNLAESMNVMCDNMSRVMDDLVAMLSALAEGDLTQRIDANYQGTFEILKNSANTSAEQLAKTMGDIKAATREVTNASAEISTSTNDLSQRTEEQAASLEETSASMEEIAATVKKNAENAQQANKSAANARDVADRGGQVVAKAVEAMGQISSSSSKISDIIGVIDEIARQTNLLALNAAVEAARAGEAGRGFAVVATEVRSLAQRSSQAAKDIKDLITNSNGQVQSGVDLVNRAGEALAEIVNSIRDVATIVSDIASASAEQANGIEQVGRALTQMDEVTQQNSALVEENAATAKTLERQAHAMSEQVAFFRLDEMIEEPVAAPVVTAPAIAPRGRGSQVPAAQPATRRDAGVETVPPKRSIATATGGPVRRMQSQLATAFKEEMDWKEF